MQHVEFVDPQLQLKTGSRRWALLLKGLIGDLLFSLRVLWKNPAYWGVVVLTLALGIGATTAVFSVVNAVVLRPLPFSEPERLVMLWEKWSAQKLEKVQVSPGNFTDWKQQTTSFEYLAPILRWSALFAFDGEPIALPGVCVNGDFFRALGARPVLGRIFVPEEERPGAERVAIIGHGLWLKLGGDRNIVGKTILLNREHHRVVGVLQAGFSFPDDSQVWFPLALTPVERANRDLRVIGKLKAGIDAVRAEREMRVIADRLALAYPKNNTGVGVTVVPLQEEIVGQARQALLVLSGAVVCVLLIAFINVANLQLLRAVGRTREVALRIILGASRLRVMRLLLIECLLLVSFGGALGFAWAYFVVRAFVKFDPIHLPRAQEIAIDPAVLAFTLMVSLATGILLGLVLVSRTSSVDLHKVLKQTANAQITGNLRGGRGRSLLAAAQIGLAIALLAGAALLLRSFVLRVTVPLGFQPEGIVAVELPWTVHRRVDDLLERLGALPGVKAAAAGTVFPHERPATVCGGCVEIEGLPDSPGQYAEVGIHTVTPEYFYAARISLRDGRFFNRSNGPNSEKVVVINESFARRFFVSQNVIGRRLRHDDSWWSIIGVAGDVTGFGIDGVHLPAVYFPHHQARWNNAVRVIVRTSVTPASMARTVRSEVRQWNKRVIIGRVEPLDNLLSATVVEPRFYMMVVSGFAVLALIIASVGVYGTVNFSVMRRTHEIGVRIALGATRTDVFLMVLREGAAIVGAGMAVGLVGAWAAARLLKSLLFGIRTDDLRSFAGASAVLILVGMLASCLPARGATKVEPMVALRSE